jgi:secreted trypsin-like serine protease
MMRLAFVLVGSLALVSAALASGAALAQDDTEMIVGGNPAPEGKYPYQVRLYSSAEDDRGFCGGSIIAPQWILTAAHCAVVDNDVAENLEAADKIFVGYGSIDRTTTTKIESEQIIVHPGYLARALASGTDVALIKLKESIPDAQPVELANADTETKFMTRGVKVTVTGWGAIWDPEDKEVVELLAKISPQEDISEKLNFPKKLYEADINVMDREECRSIYGPQQLDIADSEICALKPRSVSNSCYGDSGGPLVVQAKDPKRYVQVGVVSWGDRCGRAGNPNVFARVASFSDWINETMNAAPPAVAETPDDAAPAEAGSPASDDMPTMTAPE